jgi:hypothetical protein
MNRPIVNMPRERKKTNKRINALTIHELINDQRDGQKSRLPFYLKDYS